ncbi:group I truncated hemoglobin [Congregibacter sp.]|uniref:group I truncated hemoglobin n=1 Tax=Congregibacter sp. TaxID=2744308 RepID=UPI003F6C1A4E
MRGTTTAAIATLATTTLLTACAMVEPEPDALYRELGQQQGIEAIVDEFLYALADNERSLPLFANTNIERFRTQFALQLCAVSGGPCQYEGDSMEATHRGMNIDRAQFNTVVSDLIQAMEARDVPTGTQNALLARLAPMYSEIAGH